MGKPMKIKSRPLLHIAGGWLILINLAHTWGYYSGFVTREMLDPARAEAYELMKHPVDGGIMNASFWTVLQMLALELTFFLAFAAILTFWIASHDDTKLHAGFAKISTLVFALAAIAFLLIHPQIHAAVIAIGATLFFGLAWLGSRFAE